MLNPLPSFVSSYLGHITIMCFMCCVIFHYVAVLFYLSRWSFVEIRSISSTSIETQCVVPNFITADKWQWVRTIFIAFHFIAISCIELFIFIAFLCVRRIQSGLEKSSLCFTKKRNNVVITIPIFLLYTERTNVLFILH